MILIADLIHVFLDNIGPVFLIAGIGWLVGRHLEIDARQFGRVLFNVFSPALVFRALATTQISLGEFGLLFLTMVIFVGIMIFVGTLVARLQTSDKIERTGIVLTAICPNDGNLGLPIVDFAFGPEVLARAVIIYITATILNFTVGVYVASSGRNSPRQALMHVFKIPVVYAVIVGFIVNILDVKMPLPIERSVNLLAQATIPVMIVLLGVQLAQAGSLKNLRLVATSVGLRLLVAPVIALSLALLLHLDGIALTAFVMQASMPVAVATTVFATEFNLSREQIVSSVVASTLFSTISLSVLILLLKS